MPQKLVIPRGTNMTLNERFNLFYEQNKVRGVKRRGFLPRIERSAPRFREEYFEREYIPRGRGRGRGERGGRRGFSYRGGRGDYSRGVMHGRVEKNYTVNDFNVVERELVQDFRKSTRGNRGGGAPRGRGFSSGLVFTRGGGGGRGGFRSSRGGDQRGRGRGRGRGGRGGRGFNQIPDTTTKEELDREIEDYQMNV